MARPRGAQHGPATGAADGAGAGSGAGPQTDRLVSYTDAVTAIALTLLALPLVDAVREGASAHQPLGDLLHANLSALGAFGLSFLLISRYWRSHHDLMHLVARTSSALLSWNAAWVLAVVVLPVATQVITSYEASAATALVYGAVLLVLSGALLGIGVTARRQGLVRPGASLDDRVVGSLVSVVLLVLAAGLGAALPGSVSYRGYLLLLLSGVAERAVRRLRRAR